MNKVITVSREFGSGGRELGVKLAEALGIPFYDKELISMAADDINIAEEAFRKYDEHVIEDDPLDHKIHHSFSELYKVPMSDQIFVAQSNVIRRLASHGPCVIVGRCADYALADYPETVSVFICADEADKIERIKELHNVNDAKARDIMIKLDKKRSSYYNYYASKRWGDSRSYDLCINSSAVGIDGAVKIILEFAKLKQEQNKAKAAKPEEKKES